MKPYYRFGTFRGASTKDQRKRLKDCLHNRQMGQQKNNLQLLDPRRATFQFAGHTSLRRNHTDSKTN